MRNESSGDSINTVVIGGGQAGLATSYHLQHLGVDHTVLDENEEVGASWRNRWDSLHLFTPRRFDSLPGLNFPGTPHSLPGKDDVAGYLRDYATQFELPVRTGVEVTRVSAVDGRYAVETTDGVTRADNVVVATGAFHNPRVPEFAPSIGDDIVQLHSSEYRRPQQLRDGPVLVVGAGQSGAEIALELVRDHQVFISGEDHGEEPVMPGSTFHRFIAPIMVFAVTKVINVANPIGRKVRDHFLYPPRGIPRAGGTRKRILEAGIEWVGRTTGTRNGRPQLEEGRVLDVANVIWCTGFVTDFGWIDLPIFDEYGYPIHDRGVVESHPGLYFMGLLFQRTLSSALIVGVGKDAAYVAKHIKSRQRTFAREAASTR